MLSTIAIGIMCSSCALRPPLPPERRISVAEVVERVQCELYQEVGPYVQAYDLTDWSVGYALTLKVEDEGSVLPSADFIDFIPGGTFTLSANFGATHTATRTALTRFSVGLKDLHTYKGCDFRPLHELPVRYFSDGTGLGDWFHRVMGPLQNSDDLAGLPSELSQELEFTIKAAAGVSPSWVLVYFKPKSPFAISRKDSHKLAVAFVKNPRQTIPEVCVTNMGRPCKQGSKELVQPDKTPLAKEQAQGKDVGKRGKAVVPQGRRTPVDDATQDRLDRALDRIRRESDPRVFP